MNLDDWGRRCPQWQGRASELCGRCSDLDLSTLTLGGGVRAAGGRRDALENVHGGDSVGALQGVPEIGCEAGRYNTHTTRQSTEERREEIRQTLASTTTLKGGGRVGEMENLPVTRDAAVLRSRTTTESSSSSGGVPGLGCLGCGSGAPSELVPARVLEPRGPGGRGG